jgi:hypothetical protein
MVKIGTVGRIISGEHEGWHVQVNDDTANTGGFLVLVSRNPDFQGPDAFDDWVASSDQLTQYFLASRWVIDWNADGG